MAEQSEITSSDLAAITSGATACDHLAELAQTRTKFATFLDWIVSDPSGNLATDFKTAIINQLLFDAAKKGWFVRSNPTTGFLELVEFIPLDGLDDGGATTGDILVWNGSEWEPQSAIYLAPTSGGTTLPAPNTGGLLSVAHGFSAAPKQFACFLECTSADAGYAIGDRVDALGLIQRGNGGETRQGCTVGVNASLLFAVFVTEGSNPKKYFLPNKSSFEITDSTDAGELDPAKWSVKFWALP
jgi:hypothetical protein